MICLVEGCWDRFFNSLDYMMACAFLVYRFFLKRDAYDGYDFGVGCA